MIRRICTGMLPVLMWLVLTSGGPACSDDIECLPLCMEISPEHPLLIFRVPPEFAADGATYAENIARAWSTLPNHLKPFSVLQIEARGPDVETRHFFFQELLPQLQAADIPVILRLTDPAPRLVYPTAKAEELLVQFPCIKGIQAVGLAFDDYYEFSDGSPGSLLPHMRWLIRAIEVSARHGRFAAIELDQINWPRLMANTACLPLYEKMKQYRSYTVPIVRYRGTQTISQTAAVMGLWLEGAADQWGVAPHSRWYADAGFMKPGTIGSTQTAEEAHSETGAAMPPALYQAMIYTGAMMGACAYSFSASDDLWYGPDNRQWEQGIGPALDAILEKGLIARQDFVRKKARAAYQLAPARTPEEFHQNLRDIDGVLDDGLLMQATYGLQRAAETPELIPDLSHHYWLPIVSPNATESALSTFATVVHPGGGDTAEAWTHLIGDYSKPDSEGNAYVVRIGRGTFVLNSNEFSVEHQTFRIAEMPAPVRSLSAKRQDDGVLISWPFRDGDLSYKVYRRTLPDGQPQLLAGPIESNEYRDASAAPDQTVAYSVTALTDETETFEGTVGFGEFMALSNVESRIAEEAVLSPMLAAAESKPIDKSIPASPPTADPFWVDYAGVTASNMPVATEIVRQIDLWSTAIRQQNADSVISLYAREYEDSQGWQRQYAQRAYQWFFEHYNACTMAKQIRRWDFGNYEGARRVGVLLYCRFQGFAASDPTGRFADRPVHFPKTSSGEIWVHFALEDQAWRIIKTDPALPNFRDILLESASPYDYLEPGPDPQPKQ